MAVVMHATDSLTMRPIVGIVGRKDAALARTELGCDYAEYIGAMIFPHPESPERNTVVYRYRAGMFAREAVSCVDCQTGNHGKCDGELWTSATPCACTH